jgi:hypothetical protein
MTFAFPFNRMMRTVALLQGIYFLATGIWPIVHLRSFLAVTGPKTDLWLVQFFGALVCVPGLVLLHAAWIGALSAAVLIAGCASAIILLVGDVIFVARRNIGRIYLMDAAIELLLLIGWAVALVMK